MDCIAALRQQITAALSMSIVPALEMKILVVQTEQQHTFKTRAAKVCAAAASLANCMP